MIFIDFPLIGVVVDVVCWYWYYLDTRGGVCCPVLLCDATRLLEATAVAAVAAGTFLLVRILELERVFVGRVLLVRGMASLWEMGGEVRILLGRTACVAGLGLILSCVLY